MEFDKNDTMEKVAAIVMEQLHVSKEDIQEASEFHDLGADSLDMVEIVLKLEDVFGMKIGEEDAERFHNVDEVVDYIHKRRTK
ncbi:acyl carrier protein [Candidatus Dependentiae bacterium]|nr:acyl carrier protein [Candidatus Dependentiae bacterium]